ncbi:hypothetical protein SASPL_119616 [Salvia splendens]|uniref:NAD(+) diphosphatase n=1 Tax=Salvia splendens TaxID=180675 RepID=A0A8X8XNP2_SALSN|nr:hypothetical protein SASPL_119616 [Salvia splendens]
MVITQWLTAARLEDDAFVYLGCRNEIGDDDDVVYWAVDVSEVSELVNELGARHFCFVELRTLMVATDWADSTAMGYLAIVGHARALLEWHNTVRFCGYCGCQTVSAEAGRWKQCSNESCKKRIYPRVDPPGESFEEAVKRETWEETGIEVGEVVYHSSQPWPVGPGSMPCQLMVSFFAYARTFDINVDKEELGDAKWHSREDVTKALTFTEYKKAQMTAAAKVEQMCKGVEKGQNLSADFNVESGELATMFIPGPFAIAHHLISSWSGIKIRLDNQLCWDNQREWFALQLPLRFRLHELCLESLLYGKAPESSILFVQFNEASCSFLIETAKVNGAFPGVRLCRCIRLQKLLLDFIPAASLLGTRSASRAYGELAVRGVLSMKPDMVEHGRYEKMDVAVYASSLTSTQGCLENTSSGLLLAHCLYSLLVGYINTLLFILSLLLDEMILDNYADSVYYDLLHQYACLVLLVATEHLLSRASQCLTCVSQGYGNILRIHEARTLVSSSQFLTVRCRLKVRCLIRVDRYIDRWTHGKGIDLHDLYLDVISVLQMNRRFSIPITKRRCVVHVLGRRNRVYPRVNHASPRDDAFNLETECVLETMRNMTPEEAVSYSAQAVAEAEVAMLAAEEAMREAEAAAAEAQAATEAFEKMKAEARKRSRKFLLEFSSCIDSLLMFIHRRRGIEARALLHRYRSEK